MPVWHHMDFEQARMKLIDGSGITHPGLAPDYLLLVRANSPLRTDPDSTPYEVTQLDFERTDWETT